MLPIPFRPYSAIRFPIPLTPLPSQVALPFSSHPATLHTNPPPLLETPAPTLSLSKDAGRYLCEFIYYTGLWEHYKREPPPEATRKQLLRKRPVLFLHVPGGAAAADIALGARVAEGLIAAVVGRWEEEDKGRSMGRLEGFGGGMGDEGNEKWVEGGRLGDAEGKGWEGT